jgi:hypothetical protein
MLQSFSPVRPGAIIVALVKIRITPADIGVGVVRACSIFFPNIQADVYRISYTTITKYGVGQVKTVKPHGLTACYRNRCCLKVLFPGENRKQP